MEREWVATCLQKGVNNILPGKMWLKMWLKTGKANFSRTRVVVIDVAM